MPDETAAPAIPEDFRAFKVFRETDEQPAVAAESAPAVQDQSAEPVETPATETAGEKDASKQEQEQERDEHGKFKPKEPTLPPEVQAAVDKRISKAVAAQRDAERRAEEAERRATERQAPEPATTPKPATDSGEPKLEEFDSIPAYLDARDTWRDNQRSAQQAEIQQKTKVQTFVQAGTQLSPEFTAMAHRVGQRVTPDVANAIVENGEPKLVTYLHEHPEELQRIEALYGAAAALEIGKLHARITQPAPETAKPAVSRAPKPPATVGAPAAPTKPNIYDENIDFRVYKAEREAELARK